MDIFPFSMEWGMEQKGGFRIAETAACLKRRLICRFVRIDIALMFFKGLGVDRFTVTPRIEIIIRGLFRVKSGIDGFCAGVADRSGG